MTWPRISIVTPNFNQGDFLEETIDSVLSQGYPELEYAIVDGGSTDSSLEVIRRHQAHLAFWISEPDQGQYHAIAKGHARTTGEVMGWLNSDDVFLPRALQTVGGVFGALAEVQWLTTLAPVHLERDGLVRGVSTRRGFSLKSFLDGRHLPGVHHSLGGVIQQESTFWRRGLWERVGGFRDLDLNLAGDFYLWTRFLELAPPHLTRAPLGAFRRRPLQRSSDRATNLRESRQALEALRTRLGARASRLRALGRALQLHRLRGPARSLFSYQGLRVQREPGDGDELAWIVKRYHY
jgi:glycosyltransferase involved in cell wall biosynthesis